MTTQRRFRGSTRHFSKADPLWIMAWTLRGGSGRPTYETLMTATDQQGHTWSYLANERRYRTVRRMEQRNLVVPLTGDFAGTTALRRVGSYLSDRRLRVGVFYLSN